NDDLNTAKGLAVLWEMLKSNLPSNDKYDLVLYFDEVFGLGLKEASSAKLEIPVEVLNLVEEREELRKEGKWQEADNLRMKIEKFGFRVEDVADGPKVKAAR
ncbi:MAG: Cysteine-tRNA ligase, partial [Candidatus Woesebacteria bacterium GW2011_GWA2_44_33]